MNLTQQVSPFLTLLHALLRKIKPYCSTANACYLVLLLLLYVYWNSPEYSPVCPRYQKSNIPISIRIARTSRSISTESWNILQILSSSIFFLSSLSFIFREENTTREETVSPKFYKVYSLRSGFGRLMTK